MEEIRNDVKKTKKPDLPLIGSGKDGKMAGATTITQHLMRTVYQVNH
jgi:hypothetical protein